MPLDTPPQEVPESRRDLHVAIIMDGSGRWAALRGLPRARGYPAGATAVRRIVAAASELGVDTLTLFAFSADNWQRPPEEVAGVMDALRKFLDEEHQSCASRGISLRLIGRRDRLSPALLDSLGVAEGATASGATMALRIAVDYSSREAILRAARSFRGVWLPTRDSFVQLLAEATHAAPSLPPVDLLIRSGGEQRLSDFMLWECAWAELYFTPRLWPDFEAADLEQALRDFQLRERSFGRTRGAGALASSLGPMSADSTSARACGEKHRR